jgi:hypothetical protein
LSLMSVIPGDRTPYVKESRKWGLIHGGDRSDYGREEGGDSRTFRSTPREEKHPINSPGSSERKAFWCADETQCLSSTCPSRR